jgi:hypothetical protein
MAKAKRNRKNTALALPEKSSTLEQLAKENKLSEADVAILHEVAANRRAIVKLGALVLDHERRISALEEAVGELAGEEPEPIDIEAEKEDEDEDED